MRGKLSYFFFPRKFLVYLLSGFFATVSFGESALSGMGQKSNICGSWNNYCRGAPAPSPRSSPSYTPSPRYSPPQPSPYELKKRRANGLNDSGLAARKRGDYAAAIRYYKQALALLPNNRTYRRNMGIAYNYWGIKTYKQKDYASAKRYFENAFKYAPGEKVHKKNLEAAKRELRHQRYQETCAGTHCG